MNARFEKLLTLLKSLTTIKFYGKVEIIFNAGKIVNVKKEEHMKLD